MLTPGRYVVVPTCTGGCISGDERGKKLQRSAAGTTGRQRHAPQTTADEQQQPVGEGVGISSGAEGGGDGPLTVSEEQGGEEGRDGDGDGDGGDGDDDGDGDENDGGGDGDEGGRARHSFDRPDVLAALGDMFDGLDADCDGVLSREEVKGAEATAGRKAAQEYRTCLLYPYPLPF